MTKASLAAESLLQTFPRQRPPLTEAHQRVYAQEYKKTRGESKPLTSKVSSGVSNWMHRQVAAISLPGAILEIGAGTLNHLPFEQNLSKYDVVEPFTYLYEGHPNTQQLRNIFSDIKEVSFENTYSRIISIAALEHLVQLPFCLAKSGILLNHDGVFQAAIPSEGGFVWGLAWRTTTGLAYRLRTGLDYKTLMRHEHINTAQEIITLIQYFFEDVRVRYFPLPAIHLSLFIYLECRKPRLERCKHFLEIFNE